MHLRTQAVAALLAGACGVAVAAELFTNGSFESHGGISGRQILSTPYSGLPGWLIDGPGMAYEASGADRVIAGDGNYYLSFGHNGATGGWAAQTFATTPGRPNEINYRFVCQQAQGPGQSFRVTVKDEASGRILAQDVQNLPCLHFAWTEAPLVSFTALGTSTTLMFEDTSNAASPGTTAGNWGLDYVRVREWAAPSFSGTAGGTPESFTLVLKMRVAEEDRGRSVQAFVAAQLPDGRLYFRDAGGNWKGPNLARPWPGTLTYTSSDATQDIQVLGSTDVRGLSGTRIYLGYGANDEEMINRGLYGQAYVIP